jgi:hypothetical protein
MASKLPKVSQSIINSAFEERGQGNVVMWEVLSAPLGSRWTLRFESANSESRQGVFLATDQHIEYSGDKYAALVLWLDTSPEVAEFVCFSSDERLHLYNIWDKGAGMQSQAYSSGMRIESIPEGRRYRCNDIGFDAKFDKLVFTLSRSKGS